jgi:hypothetical protein
MPALGPMDHVASVETTGPNATHRVACWNIPTPDEAASAHPERAGFAAAPPPIPVEIAK